MDIINEQFEILMRNMATPNRNGVVYRAISLEKDESGRYVEQETRYLFSKYKDVWCTATKMLTL
ncbi:hypothetical protein MM5_086 [Morganella phage vB_Mm5]